MSTGTGVAPSTDRCPDCGHLSDEDCGCTCCWAHLPDEARNEYAERVAGAFDPDALGDPDSRPVGA